MLANKKNLVVFYDDPCLDGAAAAWAIREALKNDPFLQVTYVPLPHAKPMDRTRLILQHLHTGDEAIFVDTSPKDDTLNKIIAPEGIAPRIRKLTVIDHHASEVTRLRRYAAALGMKPGAPCEINGVTFDFILDAKKPAAALMAWEHFHPEKAPPPLLTFVGLMEPPVLLKRMCDFEKAAYIDAQPIGTPEQAFKTIGELVTIPIDVMKDWGRPVFVDQLRRIKNVFRRSVRFAHLEILPGRKEWVPFFHGNVRDYGRYVNVVMNRAARQEASGVAAAWYEAGAGVVKISLRSNGQPNVGKVAQHLAGLFENTGGGHATDAALLVEKDVFEKRVMRYTKRQRAEFDQNALS